MRQWQTVSMSWAMLEDVAAEAAREEPFNSRLAKADAKAAAVDWSAA